MAFEVYYARRATTGNTVAISKDHITLNPTLISLFGDANAELAYDRDTQTIRILPVKESGLTIKNKKIGAKGFLTHFGIDKKGKFPAIYDEQDKCIYVEMNDIK